MVAHRPKLTKVTSDTYRTFSWRTTLLRGRATLNGG